MLKAGNWTLESEAKFQWRLSVDTVLGADAKDIMPV